MKIMNVEIIRREREKKRWKEEYLLRARHEIFSKWTISKEIHWSSIIVFTAHCASQKSIGPSSGRNLANWEYKLWLFGKYCFHLRFEERDLLKGKYRRYDLMIVLFLRWRSVEWNPVRWQAAGYERFDELRWWNGGCLMVTDSGMAVWNCVWWPIYGDLKLCMAICNCVYRQSCVWQERFPWRVVSLVESIQHPTTANRVTDEIVRWKVLRFAMWTLKSNLPGNASLHVKQPSATDSCILPLHSVSPSYARWQLWWCSMVCKLAGNKCQQLIHFAGREAAASRAHPWSFCSF